MGINGDLRLKSKNVANFGRPGREIGAVGVEHRDRKPVHAEGDAAGMGGFAIGVLDAPGRAESKATTLIAKENTRHETWMTKHAPSPTPTPTPTPDKAGAQ